MEINLLSELILIITSIIGTLLLLKILSHQLLSFNFDTVEDLELWHRLENETDIFLEAETDLETFEVGHEGLNLQYTVLNFQIKVGEYIQRLNLR